MNQLQDRREHVNNFIRQHFETMKPRDIAKKLGCHNSTVAKITLRLGLREKFCRDRKKPKVQSPFFSFRNEYELFIGKTD